MIGRLPVHCPTGGAFAQVTRVAISLVRRLFRVAQEVTGLEGQRRETKVGQPLQIRDGHMAPATLYKVYYPARAAAGRTDLRWHDLRHTGAVLAAQTGATLAELVGRLGHSTPGAAMRYQHAAADRDAEIAGS